MPASDVEIDMYNELANIGGGNAATALSQMLNAKVDLGLPKTAELTLADIEELIGDGTEEVAVVLLTTVGDLAGTIVLLISDPDAIAVALGVTDEFLVSALGEIGNIVGSRFLISVGEMIMVEGEVEPPAVGIAERCAALETVVALAAQSEPFFVLRTDLDIESLHEHNELLYFPAESTIDRLRGLC
ncbi:MAG: chemotaxis protein CheC [Actinomycetota bacterium]